MQRAYAVAAARKSHRDARQREVSCRSSPASGGPRREVSMTRSAVRAPWHLLPIFAAVLALPLLARGDGAGPSRAALEQEYQVRADPTLLFKLGQVALAEGRMLDAQDFMRRFLADPQSR